MSTCKTCLNGERIESCRADAAPIYCLADGLFHMESDQCDSYYLKIPENIEDTEMVAWKRV